MAELTVGLNERSYPIFVESGCLGRVANDLAVRQVAKRYAIIADSRVTKLYGDQLLDQLLAAGISARLFPFPEGEKNKNMATITALASRLALAGYDRQDGLIALGGGVTGDITGFLASIYMRGIPFVQIPTTLLAQVDSSVGGKTGVDIPEGKNLVGTFYQPKAVYIDCTVLATLAREELLSGLAEVIKYGIIYDSQFFTFLGEFRRQILHLEPQAIMQMILTCCRIKAEVVAKDEREGGIRRILNFGHTLGHAIESASQYSLSHGFAVAIGMHKAAQLSVMKKRLSGRDAEQIYATISSYGLPVEVPGHLDRRRIKSYLKSDKKTVGGQVFFVLPDAIGSTYITDEVSERMIDAVLA